MLSAIFGFGTRRSCYDTSMALNERDFYIEKPETKPATYTCPHCTRLNENQ